MLHRVWLGCLKMRMMRRRRRRKEQKGCLGWRGSRTLTPVTSARSTGLRLKDW